MGSTSTRLPRAIGIFLVALLAVGFSQGPAIAGISEFQTFDSEAAAAAAGWEFFGPVRDLANNFTDIGFSPTNNAAGVGGAGVGEFGGFWGRAKTHASYLDTTDQGWTMDEPLRFRYKTKATSINFDGGMFAGFFNIDKESTEGPLGSQECTDPGCFIFPSMFFDGGDTIGDNLGIWMFEPSGAPINPFRTGIRVALVEAPDDVIQRNQILTLENGFNYVVDWQYDPAEGDFGEGLITMELFVDLTPGVDDELVLFGSQEEHVNFAQRNPGATFNAFGFVNTGGSTLEEVFQFEGYFDDVQYGTELCGFETPCEGGGDPEPVIIPGDADLNKEFGTADIVAVLGAGLFESGQAATWEQGDWNGAPNPANRYPGPPPAGDGLFTTGDIVAALGGGNFEEGQVTALKDPAQGEGTNQVVVNYNAADGNFSVTATEAITSVSLESASGIFTGDAAGNLGGPFDVDSDPKIFKAVFGDNFTEVDFGAVADAGLGRDFLLNDLSASGSLAAGGTYGPDVQLNYVPIPEPSAIVLLAIGLAGLVRCGRRER